MSTVGSKPLRLIVVALLCALTLCIAVHATLEQVARHVEVEEDGYLWWSEEWMQLFGAHNFVDRGRGRILLTGSSEAREGFLFDEFEAELEGFEVYNNAYSNHTLTTLLLVLRYIETVYGPSAMPEKIVLGVNPFFALDEPPLQRSYLPRVINRYSVSISVDAAAWPPRLIPKGWFDSLASRYRLLTQQSRRYRGAVRGVRRAAIEAVAPELAGQYWVRHKLVPSKYHHLSPIDQAKQLEALRNAEIPAVDPVSQAGTFREKWAMLAGIAADHEIDLYVVNMPQSTWLVDDYYKESYDDYRHLLRSVVSDTPFLDLARFLRDDEFYDVTHANLPAARRVSQRVARFVREADETRDHARGARARRPDERADGDVAGIRALIATIARDRVLVPLISYLRRAD